MLAAHSDVSCEGIAKDTRWLSAHAEKEGALATERRGLLSSDADFRRARIRWRLPATSGRLIARHDSEDF